MDNSMNIVKGTPKTGTIANVANKETKSPIGNLVCHSRLFVLVPQE